MRYLMDQLGWFFLPQLSLSVLVLALSVAYLVARFRGELRPGDAPWRRTVMPMGTIATVIGFLGTLVGISIAASGQSDGGQAFNVAAISTGIATGLYTSIFGVVTMLVASLSCYLLALLNHAEPGD
jgi:hypothetical protein